MSILLDTNILLRLGDAGSPQHANALAAVELLEQHDIFGVLVPQVLYEYWVVATRPPANNGLGMTVADADAALDDWGDAFRLLLDERGIHTRWRSLVVSGDVKGKNGHDARLVAAMQRHGLTNLLTFNKPDFTRFPGIADFTPAEVLADSCRFKCRKRRESVEVGESAPRSPAGQVESARRTVRESKSATRLRTRRRRPCHSVGDAVVVGMNS